MIVLFIKQSFINYFKLNFSTLFRMLINRVNFKQKIKKKYVKIWI